MSQEFKFKYDEMRGSDPAGNRGDGLAEGKEQFYEYETNSRNVCFVLEDSSRIFVNYSYLISGEFSPTENTITLTFTTHTFILQGINLQPLFYQIMGQLMKQVIWQDIRYNATQEKDDPVVNKIKVVCKP